MLNETFSVIFKHHELVVIIDFFFYATKKMFENPQNENLNFRAKIKHNARYARNMIN